MRPIWSLPRWLKASAHPAADIKRNSLADVETPALAQSQRAPYYKTGNVSGAQVETPALAQSQRARVRRGG